MPAPSRKRFSAKGRAPFHFHFPSHSPARTGREKEGPLPPAGREREREGREFSLHPATLSRRAFCLLPLLALPLPLACLAADALSFNELYASIGVLGIRYSERALSLKEKKVRLRGFMAPPLKPESRFFVLTREPVAVCPFCASDAEWPVDIVVIYLKKTLVPVNFQQAIEVEGRLEIGSWTDPETRFVSQVRLINAHIAR